MRTELVICDKKYTPAVLTFGNLVKLEKMGIKPLELGDRPISAMCAYVALTANCSLGDASKLIDDHISGGGDIDDVSDCFSEAIEESGFFQAILGKEKQTKKKK